MKVSGIKLYSDIFKLSYLPLHM